MSVLGTRVVRMEDHKLITAGGDYVDDLREPLLTGAAHAMFVRSPLAHARITAIDPAAARALPGVLAVFTGADLPDSSRGSAPTSEPWLAGDTVRYVGEPVALVVAEHRYQLADAAELIDIDYDPLPAVIGYETALTSETQLFDGTEHNIAGVNGEPGAQTGAFDDCEVVVTETIENQRVAPAPLEVRGASCAWGPDGRLTMWLSTQNAQLARGALAARLEVEEDRVRVIAPDVGGGFGAKIGADPEATVLAWAAREVGRPVRWIETRSENLTSMTHGRGQRQTITIGGSKDGRVSAYRLEVVQDTGAYPRMAASMLPQLTGLMATGVYKIPTVEYASRSVFTNTTPIAAYRGAGRPEATAAIERAMDLFALRIGMDPAEVRRINFIKPSEFPYQTPSGAIYDCGEYAEALDRVLAAADYPALRAEQARRRADGDVVALGIGVSAYVEITGGDERRRERQGRDARRRLGHRLHRQFPARPGPGQHAGDAARRPARRADGQDHRPARRHRRGPQGGRHVRLALAATGRVRDQAGRRQGDRAGPRARRRPAGGQPGRPRTRRDQRSVAGARRTIGGGRELVAGRRTRRGHRAVGGSLVLGRKPDVPVRRTGRGGRGGYRDRQGGAAQDHRARRRGPDPEPVDLAEVSGTAVSPRAAPRRCWR